MKRHGKYKREINMWKKGFVLQWNALQTLRTCEMYCVAMQQTAAHCSKLQYIAINCKTKRGESALFRNKGGGALRGWEWESE